jgi:hypothetical protein
LLIQFITFKPKINTFEKKKLKGSTSKDLWHILKNNISR